ncbi:MAG: 6-bladed beta-propeller, partial [Tannerella sp.]|nr:6-bladed beta-propeller [Tannerella sp.]
AGTFLLCACNSNKNQGGTTGLDNSPVIAERTVNADGDTIITCDLSLVKSDTLDLPMSLLISSFELMRLDNNDEALIKENNATLVALSENYIGIASFTGYQLFDRKGNFIATLARQGQGPNEYVYFIYDSYIDEKNNRVYMLPAMGNSIIVCDLQGNAQSPVPLPYQTTKARFLVDAENQTVTIAILPFDDTRPVVWTQDFGGNIIRELPAGHFVIHPDFSNDLNVFQNAGQFDFSMFRWVAENDTLYHYIGSDNRLQPVFTLTSQSNDPKQHDYIELPNHYVIRLFETEPAYRYEYILLDKETLRGGFVRLNLDMLGNIPAPFSEMLVFNRGYYVENAYAFEVKEKLEAAVSNPNLTPEMREYLQKLNNNIDEDDNNIVIIGKLR